MEMDIVKRYMFIDHCKRGEVEKVSEAIAAGASVEPDRSEDYRPLHAAAEFGRLEVIKVLCEAGASVRSYDSRGQTAVDAAIANNQVESVRLLAEYLAKE